MTSFLAIDNFVSLIMRQRPNNNELLTAFDMVRQQAALYAVRWRFLPRLRIEMAGKRHVRSF